jgi:hypothetical protein
MMIRSFTLSAAVLAAALPAFAGEARVTRPIEAVSLHEGALDMVAYYTELESGAFEVVATFADETGADPKRVTLALEDGDSVRFALPGHASSLYGFARADDALSVSVEQVPAASIQAASLSPREI